METPMSPARLACCTALLALMTTASFAAPPEVPPAAEEAVVLAGWLHVESLTMADVVLEVEVNGTMYLGEVTPNGRFTVSLPANTQATLRFEKPEHLPKEVVVDTRHARDGGPGHRTRRLHFAVIMELERRMGGLTYAGPVGSIGFEEGGGCVAIAHNRERVPAKRQAVMVF